MGDPGLTVYEKRTCSTCRRVTELLTERGVAFRRVEYHEQGISEQRLRELLAKADLRPMDVLRAKEPLAAQLLRSGEPPGDELIRLLSEHPELIQRPIVETADRAVLARPPERVLELLD